VPCVFFFFFFFKVTKGSISYIYLTATPRCSRQTDGELIVQHVEKRRPSPSH